MSDLEEAERIRVITMFNELYSDIQPEADIARRSLKFAHYTSIEALENIVKSNEIWFSNPLFMNDLEEVRYGVLLGVKMARESAAIQTALAANQYERFMQAFNAYFDEFEKQHVFDTYVFSASEHDTAKTDGRLSMWRGYGGNGRGVALIFNGNALGVRSEPTPIVISKVFYGSSSDRVAHLQGYCDKMGLLLRGNPLPDDKVYLAAYTFFDRIKLFALFTKHEGFAEESEWRLVYRPELDVKKLCEPMFGYALGRHGVEPKLKLKIMAIPELTSADLSLEKIISQILLGPTTSSLLAKASICRMLTLLERPELANRVVASTIPLRSN